MPNDDTVGKGGWGVENVSKSDYVIFGLSLKHKHVWLLDLYNVNTGHCVRSFICSQRVFLADGVINRNIKWLHRNNTF